ncbi:conserved hypothetical protein [Prochlorococcus marinus str. MIT 9211]|uniref:Uncharacterized protein n=1 Tax=Prochlorococcus marinus (strain MIT 9211) TaxID=93059 RepID=A9BDC6_PROM4|nr:conserved hypothetical protein [Prochlorococcus marinus str. MIT 9211]
MSQHKVFSFIKSPCGRAKFLELSSRAGFLSKIRLSWFIVIATLRDWNLENPD